MNHRPRWLVPAVMVVLVLVVSLVASRFAQKPLCYAAGTIHIEKELEGLAKNMKTLFITVHDTENPSPMPYGAMRITLHKPPQGAFHKFYLTPENLMVMQKGAPFPSSFRLKAKLSADGQAISQAPEVFGEALSIKKGQEGIEISISQSRGPS